MEGNYPAVVLYNICRDQVIPAGMNGTPVALRHESIWANIDGFKERLQIGDKTEIFEKILTIYKIVIEERSNEIRDSGRLSKSKNR